MTQTPDSAALSLLDEALLLEAGTRERFIRERTSSRPEVRRVALAMLARIEDSPLQTGQPVIYGAERDLSGERLGDYVLRDRIGAGGMGAVYRAQREAGDFEHEVAIKIIRPGLLSDSLRARFERERQTLASLRHPNIASLYGGGRTEDGTDWFAMEFIDGAPITDWVHGRDLPRAQRLVLFETVCEAVASAHAALVVHRDITPGNVLIESGERGGTVKIIDFGIAKPVDADAARALIDDLDSPALFARSLDSLSFTPGFAAPERGQGAPVTVGADVFSLGKLLDVLLSGHDAESRSIVARATATEPGKRYPSVTALRDDVQALKLGEPVEAMNAGSRYRLRKFVARNRLASALTGAVAASLVGGLIATSVLYARAETARSQAEARFEDVRSLAGYLVFDAFDDLQFTDGTLPGLNSLAGQAQIYLDKLAGSADGRTDVLLDAARAQARLGLVSGAPNHRNLGDVERTIALYDAARENFDTLTEARPDDPDVRRAVLEFIHDDAVLHYLHHDDNPATFAALDRGIALIERVDSPLSTQDRILEADIFSLRGAAASWEQDETMVRESFERAASVLDVDGQTDLERANLLKKRGRVLTNAGNAYRQLFVVLGEARFSQLALSNLREAVAVSERIAALPGAENDAPIGLAQSLHILSMAQLADINAQVDAGETEDKALLADALANTQRARDLLLAFADANPNDERARELAYDSYAHHRGMLLERSGQTDKALAAYRENADYARARRVRDGGTSHVLGLAQALESIGNILGERGDRIAACEAYREAATSYDVLPASSLEPYPSRMDRVAAVDAALERCS